MKPSCEMKVKISEEDKLIEQKKVMNLIPIVQVGGWECSHKRDRYSFPPHLVGIEPEEDVPGI